MAATSWESCNIIVSNTNKLRNVHPLYLGISPRHALLLGISEKRIFTCCLRWRWTSNRINTWMAPAEGHSGSSNMLVTVKVLSIKNEAAGPFSDVENNVILYATEVFIRHYHLHSFSSVTGFEVRQIDCVTLTNVVFYAQTSESYDWLVKESDWRTRLLVKSCQQPLLCRRNDVCLAPLSKSAEETFKETVFLFDLHTLDCQPVHQGLIGPNTSITVLEPGCRKAVNYVEEVKNVDFSGGFDPNYISAIIVLIVVADFSLALLTPYLFRANDMKSIKRLIRQVALLNKLGMQWKTKLKIQVLVKPPLKQSLTNVDVHSTVFVTSTWMNQYKLKDLCWVKVWLNSCSENKKRLVRVCSVDVHRNEIDFKVFGLLNDHTAYITPQLWFNLNSHPSVLVQPETLLFVQPMAMDCLPDPNFAQEIHISSINTQTVPNSTQHDKQLKHYFKFPRLVCKGDVICLPINGDENCDYEDDIEDIACYVVTKLVPENDCCRVDNVKSSLYQGGAISSYIPKTMVSYLSSKDVHPIWDSPFPIGLDTYSEKMCDIIVPYLQSARLRTNVFTAIYLQGPSGCGKMTVMNAVSKMLNLSSHVVDCWEIMGESLAASEARLKTAIQKAILKAPCLLILRNIHVLLNDFEENTGEPIMIHKLREMFHELKGLQQPVIVIGLTNNLNILSSELGSLFLHHVKIEVPNKSERFKLLSAMLDDVNLGLDISLENLVKNTSGYVLGDLVSLKFRALQAAYQRLHNISNEDDVCLAGIQILSCDFDEAFAVTQAAQSDAMGAPKIPQVKWEDVGGLEDIKLELLNSVKLPLENPELLATGMRRSGVLLYGPPGTGKTLLAKAVATVFSMNFISVKGPELLSMYVGQSEENVRKVFQRARDASPVIVFFDEMDALAPNRGRSGDSGGVMDRVVSQLLAEIDGLSKFAYVFVMAATNRPDLIDPALLRPGRFDKLLYVGISEDRSSQLKILKALTRKFTLGDDVDLNAIIQMCPLCLTGADFYAMCSDALMVAVARKVEDLNQGVSEVETDKQVLVVNQQDFKTALDNLVPSVSPQLLQSYSSLATRMRR